MKIIKKDIEPILEHLNRRRPGYGNNDNYIVKEIRTRIEKTKEDYINLTDISWLYSKEALQDGLLQIELYNLGEKYKTPYPKFIESQLQQNSWGGEKIVTYTKFIKNKEYYPENDTTVLDIIKYNSCENNKIFKTMLTLSALIKNDSISCEAFASTLSKRSKYNPLPLLEVEKIKNLFNKRFKNSKIENLPQEHLNKINETFSRVSENQKNDFINSNSGHFYKISIDVDNLSQKNKLTIGKVTEGISKFIHSISYFIDSKAETVNELSITEFSSNIRSFNKNIEMIFFYSNPDKKEILIESINELLTLGLEKGSSRDLVFVDILSKYEDEDEYYNTYFRKSILEKELQSSSGKSKKMKI